MANPRLQPPAWEYFLLVSYETFPPPALDAAQVAAEVAEVRRTAPMSTAVIRALRKALTLYHPDKNRAEELGAEWAAMAEELAKMASLLLETYRRKITATSTSDADPDTV